MTSYAADKISYQEYAEKLSEIDVFKGTGAGFELDREPTRLEGVVMLIRLLGKEEEANQLKNEPCVFTDVPQWGRGYVNYAYKNGLTNGIGSNLFGSQDKINGKSYVTFLLRALGYDDSGESKDFSWSGAVDFARSIGLLDEELYFRITNNPFIRDHVAKASYNALLQPLKDGSRTLLDKLVDSGAITEEQARSLTRIGRDKSSSSTDQDKTLNGEEAESIKMDGPSKVTLTQYGPSGIKTTWSKVPGADYYRVFMSESPDGQFKVLADSEGNDQWGWNSGWGITTGGLVPGGTYYVKVTAVKGGIESRASEIASVTLSLDLPDEEYQSYLIEEYSSLDLNGYTVYFYDISMERDTVKDNDEQLYMYFMLDAQNGTYFIDAAKSDIKNLEMEIALIAAEAADYYGRDVNIHIVYSDYYDNYPASFEKNVLYDNTIKYIDKLSKWYVFYPLVWVKVDHVNDTYAAVWGMK